MGIARHATFIFLLSLIAAAPGRAAIDVWIDADTAIGLPLADVDDGLALLQAFHSPELSIRGLSVVFGNGALEKEMPIARELCERFGPAGLVPQRGAASAKEFGAGTDVTRAIAAALAERPLTILAIGPLTNVGTLVKLHPELQERIQRIVIVAGRRPGQKFMSGPAQKTGHRDFNFELDPPAMQALLDTKIELVFAPWEVSSHVWLTRDDLAKLRESGPPGAYIAEKSGPWIGMWEKNFGAPGFNPFDTLAVGWLTHPDLIESFEAEAWIEQAPDDRAAPGKPAPDKPYLLVKESQSSGARKIVYCFRPKPEFKAALMERLADAP